MSTCSICLSNLGRVYRTLRCTHQFHHKCLKQWEKEKETITNCPCCRQTYENMVLRTRPLTLKEQNMKKTFIDDLEHMEQMHLNSINIENKLITLNNMFKELGRNETIISEPRFDLQKSTRIFINNLKKYINELSMEIEQLYVECSMFHFYQNILIPNI